MFELCGLVCGYHFGNIINKGGGADVNPLLRDRAFCFEQAGEATGGVIEFVDGSGIAPVEDICADGHAWWDTSTGGHEDHMFLCRYDGDGVGDHLMVACFAEIGVGFIIPFL